MGRVFPPAGASPTALLGAAAALLLALAIAGCSSAPPPKRVKTGSVSVATVGLMREHDMERAAPILIRVFKEEATLEVWKQDRTGRYVLLRSYPICRFSGRLGPKIREGDRQAPEGFYTISPKSLNPWSRNHLAFNIGFPNALDRALGRTGSHLMVHGGCNSVGCYAMTHKRIEEIYALAREAMQGGQQTILFQAFPFRMTAENMARHADNPNAPFWRDLKQGHDIFDATGEPPRVFACDGRYAFAPASRPDLDVCAVAQADGASYEEVSRRR
jgi:murein L,D-transpeptidase YafK